MLYANFFNHISVGCIKKLLLRQDELVFQRNNSRCNGNGNCFENEILLLIMRGKRHKHETTLKSRVLLRKNPDRVTR